MACQKDANKVGMMHKSKSQRIIGKAPFLHLFHTTVRQCMKATQQLFDSYLQGTHTYTTDAMHMLLDHMLLGRVGGGKWTGDEAKTMPCTFMTLS